MVHVAIYMYVHIYIYIYEHQSYHDIETSSSRKGSSKQPRYTDPLSVSSRLLMVKGMRLGV